MGTRFKNSPQNSRPCGFQVLGPTWMANSGALWPCWTLIFWGHPATPNAKACRGQLEPRTSIRSELPRNLKSTVKGFCPSSKYSQPNSLWDHTRPINTLGWGMFGPLCHQKCGGGSSSTTADADNGCAGVINDPVLRIQSY